jgi:hypothetical protein
MAIASLRRLSRTIHKSRWDRAQQGMSTEEIAVQDKVNKTTVDASLRLVEMFRLTCAPSEVELRQAETLMVIADQDEAALTRALNARRGVYDSKGKKVGVEPDYPVQLDALKEVTKRTEILIGKKGGGPGGTTVNVQNNVGVLGRSVVTFEDRLREIQQRRGILPVEAAALPEAPEEIPDEEDPFEDAFEETRPVS